MSEPTRREYDWNSVRSRARKWTGDRARSASGGALLCLYKTGVLALPDEALKALGNPKTVELFYDEEEHIILLQPAEEGARHAGIAKVSHPKSGKKSVALRSFLKAFAVPAWDETSRYWPEFEVRDGVLFLPLVWARPLVQAPRRRAGEKKARSA